MFGRKVWFVAAFFWAAVTFAEDSVPAPEKLKLDRATYHKITISWEYPAENIQIADYRIYRDGAEIARTSEQKFTDSAVDPGKFYEYRIDAVTVGGNASAQSAVLKVKTFDSVEYEQHEQVESLVDSMHSTPVENLTALSLFSAVKAGFESLTGGSLTLNTFDSELISQMISEELEWIKAATPDWTDAERIAAQAELDQCIAEEFGGNSIEQIYIHSQLTALAEAHWEKGHKQAATMLYEFSLKFLSDQENCVADTLQRLAVFKEAELNAESSPEKIEAVLASATAERLRFFDFFPNSTSLMADYIYRFQVMQYFKYFPRLFTYENYREQAYQTVHACAVKLKEIKPDDVRLARVEAWRLVRVGVTLRDAAGNPRQGTIKITNVTADTKPELFPGDPYYEERTITVNGEAEIPVYAGHIYEITANIAMPGGNDLVMSLPSFPQSTGEKVVYGSCDDPIQSAIPDEAGAQAEIVIADSSFPYNLSFERNIDVFDLSWDWVDSEEFQAAGFKVFNGETLVATVTDKHASNIRLASPDGNYSYTVVAFNSAGELSGSSRSIVIEPGDQSAYSEFFAWLEEYFGDLPTLSTDDPDGDGVDNYHEFLNGTDPTRAPAPTPAEGQITYTKITLSWECAPELLEGTSWEIRRNGTNIGTVLAPLFTDSGLLPGVEYQYTIRCNFSDGSRSDWSSPLLLKTQKAETISYGDKLQQVVDMFNPLILEDYTAPSLISAVKSAVESVLGTNITFTVVDEELLEKMVANELEVLQQFSGTLTASERLALRNEISQMMDENFGGNSFEHMYIHGKLNELAEEHWEIFINDKTQTTHRVAAEALMDASLGFLSNHRPTVATTLGRMAMMQCQAVTQESPHAEIKEALEQQRSIWMRYFDFFDTFPEDEIGMHPYVHILSNSCRFFPVMLAYENYDHELFDSLMQLAAALTQMELHQSPTNVIRRTSAWNLVPVSLLVESSDASSGMLTIRNVSNRIGEYNIGCDMENDVRTRNLAQGTMELPVYGGHLYEMEFVTPVPGGPDWKRIIGPLFIPAGERIIYDSFTGITRETLPEGTQGAELKLKLELPNAPYNLQSENLPDALNLSWDWVAPAGFVLDHFKVYRGDTLVGTSSTQTMTGIPRLITEDSVYVYSVSAVSTTGAETRRCPAIRVLPDFSEEDKAYFEWKQHYFGDAPSLATDDPDGDGLSNYQEFILGSNPTIAPADTIPDELLAKKQPGAVIAYYEGAWNYLPEFNRIRPFESDVLSHFCFAVTNGEILSSGLSDHVGMVISGYFEAPEAGKYKFFMNNDDAARLQIDGVTVIDNNRPGSPQEYLAEVPLKAGIHSFRIEYVEYEGSAKLQIDWAGSSFERRAFDGNNIWHYSDSLGQEAMEYLQWQRDTDSDGIVDADEMKLGTDWKNKDSDSDGLSDWDEVYKYHTDPTKVDTNGNGLSDYDEIFLAGEDSPIDLNNAGFELVRKRSGARFFAYSGRWEIKGSSIRAVDRRGSVESKISISTGNIYKLEFDVKNYFGGVNPTEAVLDVYVDDVFSGTQTVPLTGEISTALFHTAYLPAGVHCIRLVWDNYRSNGSLQLDAFRMFGLKSLAAEEDSPLKLMEKVLSKRNTAKLSAESRVSPYYLEGTALFPTKVQIGDAIVGTQFSDNGWFANIPLQETEPTTFNVIFENGGFRHEGKVRWTQTNLLTETEEIIRIRKGDSLRLTAFPAFSNTGSWKISGGPVEIHGSARQAVVQRFDQVGKYILTGHYQAEGDILKKSIVVEVVDYTFPQTDIACWLGRIRQWQVQAPSDAVTFQFDKRLRDARYSVSGDNHLFSVYIDDNQTRYVAARLGEDGPILAVQKISGMGIYSSYQTGMRMLETYEDGSQLHEMTVVSSPVRPDVELRLNIFVAGVIFDDGTTSKILDVSDFNEIGIAKVRFIRSPDVKTSVCHHLSAYQNGEYIGVRPR